MVSLFCAYCLDVLNQYQVEAADVDSMADDAQLIATLQPLWEEEKKRKQAGGSDSPIPAGTPVFTQQVNKLISPINIIFIGRPKTRG